eukprot:CAMPEP_0194560442 /NCGR_PEP_ID=MMETSP0292-20121207/1616_1 /TAXON_ID=39354 /ORGANISM="Heterosigma akashiwo, Strain CCMP2393" /LENGTH=121 /DNA_ID=CAMNT_0039408613 /DNA_START=159 /DNA_END=520 /DNA_ORIENTATION=+
MASKLLKVRMAASLDEQLSNENATWNNHVGSNKDSTTSSLENVQSPGSNKSRSGRNVKKPVLYEDTRKPPRKRAKKLPAAQVKRSEQKKSRWGADGLDDDSDEGPWGHGRWSGGGGGGGGG